MFFLKGGGGWEAHKQVTDINPVVLVTHWTDRRINAIKSINEMQETNKDKSSEHCDRLP